MTAIARLVVAAIVAATMAAVAAINGGYMENATVKLRWDSIVIAREVELVGAACPEISAGPFKSAECVRQVGQYYVAYLPAGYTVRVKGGWVVGLFERVG